MSDDTEDLIDRYKAQVRLNLWLVDLITKLLTLVFILSGIIGMVIYLLFRTRQ